MFRLESIQIVSPRPTSAPVPDARNPIRDDFDPAIQMHPVDMSCPVVTFVLPICGPYFLVV